MTAKQLSLVPQEPPALEVQDVRLDELVGSARGLIRLEGLPPSQEFVESVRRWGVLEPPLVRRTGQGWKLGAGGRRLKALVVLRDRGPDEDWDGTAEEWREHWSRVRVVVVQGDGWHDESIGLVESEHREENLPALVRAVQELMADGASEQQVWEQLGIPKLRIRRMVGLARLHATLRAAFEQGTIRPAVAERASKLSVDQQEQLVEVFEREGQLTAADVRQVRLAAGRSAQEALEGAGQGELGDWWIDDVAAYLRKAMSVIPDGEDWVRGSLQQLIDLLDERPDREEVQ
jgi:ParB-like chromosome segregation protein Spo0J